MDMVSHHNESPREPTTHHVRVRARTVDMMGRQQVHGIPSALSELIKNAHDAYATRCWFNMYRPENRMSILDNGLGMTPDDVHERWLELATDAQEPSRRSPDLDATAPAQGPGSPHSGRSQGVRPFGPGRAGCPNLDDHPRRTLGRPPAYSGGPGQLDHVGHPPHHAGRD